MELLWLPMGRQWAPSDSPWAPFAPLWDALGCPLAPFGSLWGALGSLVADSWNFLKCGSHFPEKVANNIDLYIKYSPAGILPRLPALPAATRGSGVKNCYSDPTTTRAGGQDDVS